jgi:hypothetical protein
MYSSMLQQKGLVGGQVHYFPEDTFLLDLTTKIASINLVFMTTLWDEVLPRIWNV